MLRIPLPSSKRGLPPCYFFFPSLSHSIPLHIWDRVFLEVEGRFRMELSEGANRRMRAGQGGTLRRELSFRQPFAPRGLLSAGLR